MIKIVYNKNKKKTLPELPHMNKILQTYKTSLQQNPAKVIKQLSCRRLINGGYVKQINIVQKPERVFNPATIMTQYGRLISYRPHSARSQVMCFLDQNLNAIQDTSSGNMFSRNADARLFFHQNCLFLSTSYQQFGPYRARMQLRRIDIKNINNKFNYYDTILGKFDTINNFPGYVKPRLEKNWIPFSNNGKIYYIYYLNPHRILQFDFVTGSVSFVTQTEFNMNEFNQKNKFNLPTHDIRLSTTPALLSDKTYLSTYHYKSGRNYYNGFYCFESVFPFKIISIGQPIIFPQDAGQQGIQKKSRLRLLFLQSLQVYQKTNDIIISCGQNDKMCHLLQMPLDLVLGSLKKI